MNLETLRLFNAIQVEAVDKMENHLCNEITKRTVSNGYILQPSIKPLMKTLDEIESVIGISGEKANAAFHKSWKTVQDSSQETLVVQQLMHYFTTYGFESLGIYNEETIYIPSEKLKIPKLENDIPLTIIKALDSKEILSKIIDLGSSGIALSQQTLDDIMVIIEFNAYDSAFVEVIKNRELKALLFDYYGIVPTEPVEFLRHLVSKLTDESLLIKSPKLINKLKSSNPKFLDTLIQQAPDNLASIFFRFKPLFLAMKTASKNKTFFNQLRKKANKMHVPMPEDYLNSITSRIKNGKDISGLENALKNTSIFRKIRLANALKYRLDQRDSIVYRVRNGRGWATDFEWPEGTNKVITQALDVVLSSITTDLAPNVSGKTFYIPKNIHYAIPATEKQFVGNIPTGSYVSVPKDIIMGIHWEDTSRRIDLDLSMVSESGKIGWDSSHKSEDNKILFSGDLTSAPKPDGATELFYFKKGIEEPYIITVNYYNYQGDDPVNCKIIVGKDKPKNFNKDYMLDVSKILINTSIEISKMQNILGLVANVDGENRVYPTNVSIGNSITSRGDEQGRQTRNYLIGSTVSNIDLEDMLKNSGAKFVKKLTADCIDLSPDVISKETFINLLQKG